MANQMRKGADHVPHECKICLGKLMFTQYCINWFQCPSCQEVTHADCLLKHMRRSSIEIPRCVNCQIDIPLEFVNGYIDISDLEDKWKVNDDLFDDLECSSVCSSN